MSRASRAAMLLAYFALLGACSRSTEMPVPAPVDPAAVSERHLRRHLTQSPRTLDPAMTNDVSTQRILDDLFEGLTRVDAAGEVVPGIAERWDLSADGLTWTFHLRPEARWSNGEPVTARDVVFAWRRVVDPRTASPQAQQLAPVRNAVEVAAGRAPPASLGVEALDDRTVRVELVSATPYFAYLITNNYFYPVPAATLERHGRAWTQPGNLVGNGAFVLESARTNGAISVVRNPRYWDAANVRLQRVTYFPVPDFSSATSRYLAGDLDVTDGFLVDDVERLRARLGDEVRLAPYFGTVMLGFNVRRPPFDSQPLREAFTLALDRDVIATKLLHGLYEPARTLVPAYPGHPGVPPAWAAMTKEEREARARALYAAAGYGPKRPLRVALSYPSLSPDTRRVLEAATAMWRSVLGAEVALENQEWRVFQQNRRLDTYRLFWHSWIGDYLDPLTFLAILRKDNEQNVGRYEDAGYEAAMTEAATAVDDAQRLAAYARAEAIANDAAAVLPIYYYNSRHLVRRGVAGWRDNVVDRHPSRDLWLDAPAAQGAP